MLTVACAILTHTNQFTFGSDQHLAINPTIQELCVALHNYYHKGKIEFESRATVEEGKGYKSPYNDEVIDSRGLRNRIMFRNVRGRKITYWLGVFNKAVSRTRYKVERTFDSMRR